jgi:hypothetical protein
MRFATAFLQGFQAKKQFSAVKLFFVECVRFRVLTFAPLLRKQHHRNPDIQCFRDSGWKHSAVRGCLSVFHSCGKPVEKDLHCG